VVPEGAHARFDASLVACARLVVVELEHEVGLASLVQDAPEVLEDEAVGRALERGDEDRVEQRRLGRNQRDLQDPLRVVPVDRVQESRDLRDLTAPVANHLL
jgi:hypothetical protein